MNSMLIRVALAGAIPFIIVGCSGNSEPMTVSRAAEALATLPDLCKEPQVEFVEAGEPQVLAEGGEALTKPSMTMVSCDLDGKVMTSIFVFDTPEDLKLSQKMACLTFASTNPDLVDEALSDEEWDVKWINGTNWEAFTFDYPPSEIATALGGTVTERRANCIESADEMVAIAANPQPQGPDEAKAVTYLVASGLFSDWTEDLMKEQLQTFCGYLTTMTDDEVRDGFAKDLPGALISSAQADALVSAVRLGNYDCAPI